MRQSHSRLREILDDLLALFSVLRYLRFWAIFILLSITALLASLSTGSSAGIILIIGLPFVAAVGVVNFHIWLKSTVEAVASGAAPPDQEEADREFEYSRAVGIARENLCHECFAEAAESFERALLYKPEDIFTRMELAGIYRDRLLMQEAALRHFKALSRDAPRESMIREDALLAVKILVRELSEKDR